MNAIFTLPSTEQHWRASKEKVRHGVNRRGHDSLFEYGKREIAYLKSKNAKLARAIDAVGHVWRQMDEPDLLTSTVHSIMGQQICFAALATVWSCTCEKLGEMSSDTMNAAITEELQSSGITFKKAGYIKSFNKLVGTRAFDFAAVEHMSDADSRRALNALPDIGVWTAEMLLFCLGRPNIPSYGDLGIHRGMRVVYHHRIVTREMFEHYSRRFSPYGNVASLYLWAFSYMDMSEYVRKFAPKKALNTKQ